MSDFQTADGGYVWEQNYKRSWEVQEGEETVDPETAIKNLELARLRARLRLPTEEVQRGMMRHLYIVIDLSDSMDDTDLKPSRVACVIEAVEGFIGQFFDQNPIAQLGIIGTKDGTAYLISELSGNAKRHCQILQTEMTNTELSGGPSLQNSLLFAKQSLANVPAHTSREVLIILGSLSSCDSGDIFETIAELKKIDVTCSIIGLSASMRICQTICDQTHGKYEIVMHEPHLKEILAHHITPPPTGEKTEPALLAMGFPIHTLEDTAFPCFCHDNNITKSGYPCPRCGSKYCDIPTECTVCGMTLVSSAHIARSYHHLFPVPAFKDAPEEAIKEQPCYGCSSSLDHKKVSQCDWCKKLFCLTCDLYVHETLHNCPGCSVMLPTDNRNIAMDLDSK